MNCKTRQHRRTFAPALAGLLLSTLAVAPAAQTAPAAPVLLGVDAMSSLQRRCWASHTGARTRSNLLEPLVVNFGHLVSGATVRSPLWVDFGIRGMGVIPAGNPHAKAGHHHLLIDTPLPKVHNAKIPFNERHRHFGKGQTGVLLDLAPGKHTLRLLFADHEHRPYFVYSPEIEIMVEGQRSDPAIEIDAKNYEASCAKWYANEVTQPRGAAQQVFVRNLRANETVSAAFTVGLGVIGFGVAPAGSNVNDTGYFVLDIAGPGRDKRVTLNDGRTETLLELAPGDYSITPRLLAHDGKVLLNGVALPVQVNGR